MPAPGVADQGRSPVPHTIPEPSRGFRVQGIPLNSKEGILTV